jgi:hypothetical protein
MKLIGANDTSSMGLVLIEHITRAGAGLCLPAGSLIGSVDG